MEIWNLCTGGRLVQKFGASLSGMFEVIMWKFEHSFHSFCYYAALFVVGDRAEDKNSRSQVLLSGRSMVFWLQMCGFALKQWETFGTFSVTLESSGGLLTARRKHTTGHDVWEGRWCSFIDMTVKGSNPYVMVITMKRQRGGGSWSTNSESSPISTWKEKMYWDINVSAPGDEPLLRDGDTATRTNL